MENEYDNISQLSVTAIVSVLFILLATWLVWSTQVNIPQGQLAVEHTSAQAKPVEVADDASTDTTEGTAPTDMDAVILAFNKGTCIACHTIPNVPGAVGQIGPNLSNVGIDGAERREGYTAEDYIRESIKDPQAFISPECPTGPCIPGTMPPLPLEDADIDLIVSYLVTLGVE